jgi:hypothetical protein
MVFNPSQKQKDDYALAISFGIVPNQLAYSGRTEWFNVSSIGSDLVERISKLEILGYSISNLSELENAEKQQEPQPVNTDIRQTMVSQNIITFSLNDRRLTGEILYTANESFNPYYYNKTLTALIQVLDVNGVPIYLQSKNLTFTQTEKNQSIPFDRRFTSNDITKTDPVTIQFFVWESQNNPIAFSQTITDKIFPQDIARQPDPVTIFITALTDKSVTIKWSPNYDGGSPITSYYYTLKNLTTGQGMTSRSTGLNTSFDESDIPRNSKYEVTIMAINMIGDVVTKETFETITPTPIPTPTPDYNFIIENDGLVRMFRIGATPYTEIKVNPESVQSFIDRGVSRLLTAAERAIPYPRPEPEPEPEPTFCVNVYNIRDSGSVYATSYTAITAAKVAELKLTKFVLSCEATTLPTEKQIQDFYGFTPIPPEVDTSINSTMVSQSVGAFILKDGIIKGEILYIANQSFNPFYYGKNLTSLVQIKSKSGVVVTIKPNVLNFTEIERDERIQIDESAGNFKELLIDFFVWDSPTSQLIFAETKQIQVIDETNIPPTDPFDPKPPTTCQAGYHKDFSGKCVIDDPVGEIPRDKLIDTLKGFLFGTVALSLLARKY